jgi:hypothetical protein
MSFGLSTTIRPSSVSSSRIRVRNAISRSVGSAVGSAPAGAALDTRSPAGTRQMEPGVLGLEPGS